MWLAALTGVAVGPSALAKIPTGGQALRHLRPAGISAPPLVLNLQREPPPGVPRRAAAAGAPGGRPGAPAGAPAQVLPARPELARWILGPQGRGRQDRAWFTPPRSRATFFPPERVPPWLRLLAGEDPARVAADAGVDVSKTSLAHDGGTILVVVGAGPRDRTSPQLHLERDSGRLRRVLWRDRAEGLVDVRLKGELAHDGAPTGWPAHVIERVGAEERRWAVTSVHDRVVLEPGQLTPPAPNPQPPPGAAAPADPTPPRPTGAPRASVLGPGRGAGSEPGR